MTAVRTRSGHLGLRLDPARVDEAGLAAWRDLADRAAEPNPFFRPEFLVANVVERRVPRARLLVVADGPRWIACLPVRERPADLRFPLPSLVAVTDEYSFSGTPLLDPDAIDAAADGLFDLFRAERRLPVVWIGIFDTDGPVGAAMTRAADRAGIRPREHSSFRRGGWIRSDVDHFPGPGFTSHDRRQMQRRAKRLAARLDGELALVDRTGDPAALDRFLAMENSGWKAERGTALASTPADTAFFLRMANGLAPSGRFELIALEVNGTTTAMESSLIDGGSVFAWKIAFDPAYGEFSPGTILKYRLIERLEGGPWTRGDSCAAADNAHMNRLWPDRLRMRTLVVRTGSPFGVLLGPLMTARSAGRRLRDEVARVRASRAGRGTDTVAAAASPEASPV